MRPKVSVILPSLNVADYIRECVDSVLAQTLEEIEIICVDAGSVDGTQEILGEYAAKDNRIHFLQSTEKSYGKQVNMGIGAAQGKYIAILETDDFVEAEMYGYLYDLAEANNVDYAKADYDSFVTLGNGIRLYTRHKMFDTGKSLYETVLLPHNGMELLAGDCTVWRGIYSRNFLMQNHIYFNESQGAAFQDIGFIIQVQCRAERVIYTGHSFYRYRIDRENASSKSPHGLEYAYQEFQRLMDTGFFKLDREDEYWNWIYRRMGSVFLSETDKLLKFCYDFKGQDDLENVQEYYKWFCNKICKAMESGRIGEEAFTRERWFRLRLLLHSLNGYMDYAYVKYQMDIEQKQQLLASLENRKVVVFGSGVYGCRAFELFYENGIETAAFCDNNESLWGSMLGGIEIKPPTECIRRYRDAVFVIANKQHYNDIYKQLLQANIKEENIRIYRL